MIADDQSLVTCSFSLTRSQAESLREISHVTRTPRSVIVRRLLDAAMPSLLTERGAIDGKQQRVGDDSHGAGGSADEDCAQGGIESTAV